MDPKPTYLDGKGLNAVTGTSSCQRCPSCQCPPSLMNKYCEFQKSKNFKLDESTYIHGLAPMHTRMRCFIHLMNVSCKKNLDPSKSQARGQDKVDAKARKKIIQDRFREKMNICVEEPRQGGGTSTTGKIAQIALENSDLTAEILELDYNLVNNIGALTGALSSSYMINVKEFDDLCKSTSLLYNELHPNIPKNTTLHRLLDHGGDIVKGYELPPIFYSEEGSESKNKDYRIDKLRHSRLDSREHIMRDMYQRNLVWSDPLTFANSISQRIQKKKKRKEMSPLLKKLLIIPDEHLDTTEPEMNEICETEEQEDVEDDWGNVEYQFVQNDVEFELFQGE